MSDDVTGAEAAARRRRLGTTRRSAAKPAVRWRPRAGATAAQSEPHPAVRDAGDPSGADVAPTNRLDEATAPADSPAPVAATDAQEHQRGEAAVQPAEAAATEPTEPVAPAEHVESAPAQSAEKAPTEPVTPAPAEDIESAPDESAAVGPPEAVAAEPANAVPTEPPAATESAEHVDTEPAEFVEAAPAEIDAPEPQSTDAADVAPAEADRAEPGGRAQAAPAAAVEGESVEAAPTEPTEPTEPVETAAAAPAAKSQPESAEAAPAEPVEAVAAAPVKAVEPESVEVVEPESAEAAMTEPTGAVEPESAEAATAESSHGAVAGPTEAEEAESAEPVGSVDSSELGEPAARVSAGRDGIAGAGRTEPADGTDARTDTGDDARDADRDAAVERSFLESTLSDGERVATKVDEKPARRFAARTGLIAATAVLAALVVVALVVVVARRSSSSDAGRIRTVTASAPSTDANPAPSNRTDTPATAADASIPLDAQRKAMLTWTQSNLSSAAVIVADAATVERLRGAGFDHAIPDDQLDTVDWRTVDYLISGGPPDTNSTTRQKLHLLSVPVAVFSSGADPVTVAQVFPRGTADLAARRKADAAARVSSGQQLSQNPKVKALGATAALLRAGQLDLRASTVLALLSQVASGDPVMLKEITLDPADVRAHLPAHSMTVTVSNTDEAQAVLSSLTGEYRPRSTTAIAQGTLRLDWTPGIAVVLPFQ